MSDRGYGAIDYAGVFFLVVAAIWFAWAWYRRAFAFSATDEEASRVVLAASESKVASQSVEERNFTPLGRRVMLTVFFILVGSLTIAPVLAVWFAGYSAKHASHGYSYPHP